MSLLWMYLLFGLGGSRAFVPEDAETIEVYELPKPDKDVVHLTFLVKGQEVRLDLKKSHHVTSDAPVLIGNMGMLWKWEGQYKHDFAMYVDKKNMASFGIWNVLTSTGLRHKIYRGHFSIGYTEYVMEPLDSDERETRRIISSYMNSPIHMVYKRLPEEMAYLNDTFSYVRTESARHASSEEELANLYISKRKLKDKVKEYWCVETLVLIDNSIYRKWLEESPAYTDKEKQEEALSNIYFVYSHILNGIDLRYSAIRDRDFVIYIRLSGFYIALTSEDAPWTEQNRQEGMFENWAHAQGVLDHLNRWIYEKIEVLPRHDQATLFTGYELFGGYESDGKKQKVSGFTDQKGVCGYHRGSVVQERGQYATTSTATHMMAHGLGVNHDGIDNECDSKDGYQMSISPSTVNYKRRFRLRHRYRHQREGIKVPSHAFSKCSIVHLRHFLFALSAEGVNCLLNQEDSIPDEVIGSNLDVIPGQYFNVHDQCRFIYGEYSYYCGGGRKDATICAEMECWVPKYYRCYPSMKSRAFAGTTCGSKKWCFRGKCIKDSFAPKAKDFCIYGDYKDRFSDGRSCYDVVSLSPWSCYSQTYNIDCCESCNQFRNVYHPSCEYGDRSWWCYYGGLTSRDCYSASTRATCCDSCTRLHQRVRGCEYGDRASWCSTMYPRHCYASSDTCCKTCPMYKQPNQECPYGNRVSWCSMLHPRDCYVYEHLCCLTCSRMEYSGLAVLDCKYGDRYMYCTHDDCKDKSQWRDCCFLCKDVIATTPSVPSTTALPTIPPTILPDNCEGDSASWCAEIPARDCYVSADICCETCGKLARGPPGCVFGDKVGWCKSHNNKESCQRSNIRKSCCKTCYKYMTP